MRCCANKPQCSMAVKPTQTTIVLATHNDAKVRELRALLQPLGVNVVPVSQFDSVPVDEDAPTFVENALKKARAAAASSGLPALADDSGLEVDALDGAPGVRSARFAGDDASDNENVVHLLQAMQHVEPTARSARFRCVVVYIDHPLDPSPIICEGVWEGRIAQAPCGDKGFGYDPIFVEPLSGRTVAELSATCKNTIGHRGQAMQCIVSRLREHRV